MHHVSKSDGVALYVQIREDLRNQIATGALKPGQKIPSEDELATQFGVSRMTVRQGIVDLIDEGKLYRRHGKGTFVTQLYIERDHTKLTNFLESAKARGIEVRIELLRREVIPARLKVAEALALQEGEPVIQIITRRFSSGAPVTVHEAHSPHKLFPQLLQEDLEAQHVWDFIESYGCRVKRAVQRLEAREAEGEVARLLEMEEGEPVLYKERTVFADDGTPVEFTYCYNRGDKYSLMVSLSR